MLVEGDTHRVPKMSLFPTVKAGKKKILGGHTMKTNLAIVALLFMASFSASAQAPIRKDPLLDRLTGSWILQGTIAGHQTTHDIESEWVLNHEYLRLHETSREKNV